jgi:hypothetical protein
MLGSTYVLGTSSDRETALNLSRNFALNPKFFPLSQPCPDVNNWFECLKNKSTEELNYAQYLQYLTVYTEVISFKPIFGDEFVPKDVVKSIRDGDFNHDIRIFMGHNEMEGSYFTYGYDKAFNLGQRYYPQNNYSSNISKTIIYNDINNVFIYNNSISDKIATAYTEQFNDTNSSDYANNLLRRSAVHAIGDYAITCPTILFGAKIVQQLRFRGKVFQYRLTYTNSKSDNSGSIWANVTHTDDLALVFGRPLNEISNGWTKKDVESSREMIYIWTHFAKYGFVFWVI